MPDMGFPLASPGGRRSQLKSDRKRLLSCICSSTAGLDDRIQPGCCQAFRARALEGDPQRAERIYLDILRRQPQRRHHTNLGLARSLLGRHAEAVEAYRRALTSDPDNPYLLLNLADAELALGHADEAHRLYGRTLESLARAEVAATLSPLLAALLRGITRGAATPAAR